MKLRESLKNKYSILVIIDSIMMVLLTTNLTLILFDWIFEIQIVNNFIANEFPDFYAFYDQTIHQNFHSIDLVFVLIFLGEFVFSWSIAIIQKVYHKWFFYPFLHFYDLIGCIPIGSLRFLRILRIFSIVIRLHNLKVIDLSKTYLVVKIKKYYGIVVEEISDRVVVNIIDGVQEEIDDGGPVVDKIIKNVIRPKQDLIVEWVSRRIENALETDMVDNKKEIETYVQELISESLQKSKELRVLIQIPVMGKIVTETIENAISDIINNVIEKGLTDLASYKNRLLVKEASNLIINAIEQKDEEHDLNQVYSDIVNEVLEIVKEQVQVKKWKMKESAEEGKSEGEKETIEFLMVDK